MKNQFFTFVLSGAMMLGAITGCKPEPNLQYMVTVDFGEKTGKILKPVNGINNGPISRSSVGGTIDLSEDYAELDIPYIRLHDTNYPSFNTVDISCIFPNFDADEKNPDNYLFHHTDELLLAIHQLGAGVIYRLGESIDGTVYKRHARAPKDFAKWSRICANIIRHYNEGWANGFHLDIEYWEIWNEPDILTDDWAKNAMWAYSDPYDYFNLYLTASKFLKKEFPAIKIGGYAACGFHDNTPKHFEFFTRFLDMVKSENAPLDFFSWHVYPTFDTEKIPEKAYIVREELDKRGFTKTISVFDEWNITGFEGSTENPWPHLGRSDIEGRKMRKAVFENKKNMCGASFVAAHFIIMNDIPIDIAAYYDGQPRLTWCGLWDVYGIPQKTFYAFKAYAEFARGGKERAFVNITGSGNNLWCIDNQSTALLSSFMGGGNVEMMLKNPDKKYRKSEIYMLDDHSDLELVRTETLKAETTPIKLSLGKYAVVLIKLTE